MTETDEATWWVLAVLGAILVNSDENQTNETPGLFGCHSTTVLLGYFRTFQ